MLLGLITSLVLNISLGLVTVTSFRFCHSFKFWVQLPCFPDNKTGLILIFTPKYGTRAYFRGMYYFDISKNEVTK